MREGTEIDAAAIDAVVFDLDGVITRSESVHHVSWEQLFNEYLEGRSARLQEPFEPFQPSDYLEFVDGKPRYDGVASFLESRDISLPWGSAEDSEEAETVCGLGNRKNRYFLQRLETHGIEAYDTSVAFVRELQRQGIETALISSSCNVDEVLGAADLLDLFTVRVDGIVADELGIPGKPDPAVFVEAASRVGAEPANAAIVEDAQSGVEAGKAGGFRIVIGVDRGDQADELRAAGATLVVSDLGELSVKAVPPVPRANLPSAADHFGEIESLLGARKPAVFLDYDGVLTPIVEHPDLAVLSDETRAVLTDLASVATVAVVSGRDVADVRGKVQVPGIYYAGSHGFDIISPSGEPVIDERLDRFTTYLAPLDAATEQLEDRLRDVPGAQVERKRFAIAVHYRRVADTNYALVEKAVRDTAPTVPSLRVATGKKIFEFRPDFDWDKGRAMRWLLGELGLDREMVTPVYLGDDTTDEDAFRVIRKRGVGVVVGREGEPSLARFALEDTGEVTEFLARIAEAQKL
ncbi:MAG: trehalose-phosphatase [Acidimicrobiia bacterium]